MQSDALTPLELLLVEDSADDAELICLALIRSGYRLDHLQLADLASVRQALGARAWDVVITDHAMPGLSSHDVIDLVPAGTPCIVVSGAVGEETAVGLLQRGAVDYVNKSNLRRLGGAVARALSEAQNLQARRQAELELRRAHAELEQRVRLRTRELEQANARLRSEMEERRKAEVELSNARLVLTRLREEERSHLSREIHDGVVQDLIGVGYAVADTERKVKLGQATHDTLPTLHQHRADILKAVRRLRTLVKGLRPAGLHEFGLEHALHVFVTALTDAAHLDFSLNVAAAADTLPEAVSQAFFRIAQEAVRNAVRHARADAVSIVVTLSGDEARLTVNDDGRGFQAPDRLGSLALAEHFGLVGMDEHAQLAGGQLRLESAPGRGTRIVVTVPLAVGTPPQTSR